MLYIKQRSGGEWTKLQWLQLLSKNLKFGISLGAWKILIQNLNLVLVKLFSKLILLISHQA